MPCIGRWILFFFFFLFFFAVRGPLTAVASPVVEHRLRTRRLSGHGSQAQLLCSMWDLPGLGHEPVSPALAGGLSTTAPPGKPLFLKFIFGHIGLRCCAQVFSSCGEQGLLFVVVRGLLTAVASLVAEHRL